MKLSLREKILLISLAFLFVNFIGFYYLLPSVNKLMLSKKSAFDTLELDYQNRQIYNDNYEDILKNQKDKQAELDLLATSFYDSVKTSDINEYLNNLIKPFVKQINSIDLSSVKEVSTSTEENVETIQTYLDIINVKCELSGSQAKLMNLIDAIINDPYLLEVENFDIEVKDEKMSLSFKVYAYES